MAIGIDTAFHHFNAPATLICGHSSSIWLWENGVPFRGALGEIPIHRTQSLARASTDVSSMRAVRGLYCILPVLKGLQSHA